MNRAERRAWRRHVLHDPRLTATDRMVLLAAEKLADTDGCFTLDDETMSLLQHPRVVLGMPDDEDTS
jgi:hypothetical protein